MSYNDDAINYNDQLDKLQTDIKYILGKNIQKRAMNRERYKDRQTERIYMYTYMFLGSETSAVCNDSSSQAIDDEDINAHIVTQTLWNLIRSLYVQISAKLLIMSLYSLRGDSLSFALYRCPS